MEPDPSALAHQVLDVCIRLKPGERVWVNSWDHTLELAYSLAWECEKRNCPVVVTVQPEDLWLRSLAEGPLDLVDGLPAHQAALLSETDVYIYTLGPRHPIPWEKIPEDRRKLATFWFFEKNKFVEQWKNISRRRKVRMLGVEATLATPERARVLGLDHVEWSKVMFDGCLANYHEVERRGKALLPTLAGKGAVHITTPHGTDFAFKLDRRPVDIGDGLSSEEWALQGRVVFLPAGGVEVSADEESAEGKVVFDSPILSLVKEGKIEKLSLRVARGRMTESSAASRGEAFDRFIEEGKGDADRFGFFGFGLNQKLRHGFTQDDKVLGGVTLGFGDNSDKAGRNKADRGFWASMRDATVTIDRRTMMKDGNLLV